MPTAPAAPAPACADCGAPAVAAGGLVGSVGAGVGDGGVVGDVDGGADAGDVVLGGVELGDVELGEVVELGDEAPLVPVAPGVLDDSAAPIVGLASTNDGDAVAAPAAEADCSAACTQPVTITICALPADAAPDCVSDCAVAPALSATASAPAKKTCLVMISQIGRAHV